jgi:hypothetical protein
MMKKLISHPVVFFLLWILVTMLGWSVGIFSLDRDAGTYSDVIRLLPIYFVDGLLIGLVVGIGQAFLLNTITEAASSWVWVTALGYAAAFFLGLVITVMIPAVAFGLRGNGFLPIVEPSTMTIYLNTDDLFWGALLIGFVQWRVLKNIIPNPKSSIGILWVMGTWFSVGLTFLVRAFTHNTFLDGYQMSIVGMIVGVITAVILLTSLKSSAVSRV